jgi:hypothetical protein
MDENEEFEMDPAMLEALRKRDKERQEKIDAGELTCDIDDPENCDSCGA